MPGNIPRGLGRGRGSTSEVHQDAKELVLWLARHSRRGGRPADLALLAFAGGLPVPEETVRAAFHTAIDRLILRAEDDHVGVTEDNAEDRAAVIADSAARAGQLGALVPRRIRHIDGRLRDMGLSWAPASVKRMDWGSSSSEPMTTQDFATMALTVLRLGAPAIWNQDLGDVARALLPADAASPLASMIEHLSEDPSSVSVQEMDGVVPVGDLRDALRQLTANAPLEILQLAWQTVDGLCAWAENLYIAVEAELDAREPGEATLAWFLAAALGARLFLVVALRHHRHTLSEHAQLAAELLLVRAMLQRLWQQTPEGSWELLANPAVVPACLQRLIDPGFAT